MDSTYKNFYRKCYLKTNGFIPTRPLNQNIYPGDFFQIINGEMIVLGNVFRYNVINLEKVEFGYSIKLNPTNWSFNEGVRIPYSGIEKAVDSLNSEFEFTKQILNFTNTGSFIFKAQAPESVKILNWNDIQNELIIKLTQTIFSFREVYVVSECVTAESITLAIAGSENAELEIASDIINEGIIDIFGCSSTKAIQSKDLEYYNHEMKRKPIFFKAKKLAVQDDKVSVFMNEYNSTIQNTGKWVKSFFEDHFYIDESNTSISSSQNAQIALLDMLGENVLNPNTALMYFKWNDANLDDIEKMFIN